MPTMTPGRIFLADRRLTHQNTQIRIESLSAEPEPETMACTGLQVLNDVTLGAAQQTGFELPANSYTLTLPVTGAVDAGELISVGRIGLQRCARPAVFTLKNPYAGDRINFLTIGISTREKISEAQSAVADFDPDSNGTHFNAIDFGPDFPALPFRIFVKLFTGRQEAVHRPHAGATLFAFVIAGAFEAEGRLLHERDGLSLHDAGSVEFEALSAHAVLLLIEFS